MAIATSSVAFYGRRGHWPSSGRCLGLVIVRMPAPACFRRGEGGRFGELETVERLRVAVAIL